MLIIIFNTTGVPKDCLFILKVFSFWIVVSEETGHLKHVNSYTAKWEK